MAKTTRFSNARQTFFCALLCVVVIFCSLSASYARPNTASRGGNPRYAAVIMDAQTGKVLHASGADIPRYPASLTKMMTLFLTFEAIDRGRLNLNSFLKVSSHAINQPPSKVGLRIGDRMTVNQAILALVTRSANDVAMAMAETIGGSEKRFGTMMTERARSLGMKNSFFFNPSGLPDQRQKTTARDMAILSRALMQYFPHHYHFFGTKSFVYKGQTITTHNNLMKRFAGMDGLKTGFINASGFNLAASAVKNNRRVIVVVFGGRSAVSRDNHVADLMNRGFAMLARTKQPIQVATRTQPVIQPSTPAAPLAAQQLQPIQHASKQPTQQPTQEKGNWGIQVGAYGSEEMGQQALRVARSILTNLPSTVQPIIMPVQTPQGFVYRARFLGLSAESANQSCQRLRECMVFAMH